MCLVWNWSGRIETWHGEAKRLYRCVCVSVCWLHFNFNAITAAYYNHMLEISTDKFCYLMEFPFALIITCLLWLSSSLHFCFNAYIFFFVGFISYLFCIVISSFHFKKNNNNNHRIESNIIKNKSGPPSNRNTKLTRTPRTHHIATATTSRQYTSRKKWKQKLNVNETKKKRSAN